MSSATLVERQTFDSRTQRPVPDAGSGARCNCAKTERVGRGRIVCFARSTTRCRHTYTHGRLRPGGHQPLATCPPRVDVPLVWPRSLALVNRSSVIALDDVHASLLCSQVALRLRLCGWRDVGRRARRRATVDTAPRAPHTPTQHCCLRRIFCCRHSSATNEAILAGPVRCSCAPATVRSLMTLHVLPSPSRRRKNNSACIPF